MWGLPAIVRIAIKRMLKQGGLTLLAMLGVTFAVAFCTAIPLYTNTVYNRVLQTELYDKRRSMPAFGLLFRYKGQPEKNLSWDDIQPVRDYLTYHSASALALPQKIITQFVVSPIFDLYPPDQTQFEKRFSLTELSFGTQSDVEDHISIVREVDASPNPEALNILVSEQMLYYQGWTIGQQFIALLEQKTSLGLKVIKIPIQISGIWTRTEPKDPYWFFNPTGLLEDTLLLPESTYEQQFAPLLDDDVANALWYMILDGDAFRPNQTEAFLRRLNAVTVRAGSLLPNLELMVAPAAKALREFQAASRWLTVAMFALSVPVLVIIIIFLGMVVSFITQHQRAEIAILRSRGATEEQTIGIAAVQAIVIGAFAMTAGTPLGRWIAVQLAKTRGFLNFSGLSEIELLITPANIQIGLAIICGLVLAMGGLTIQHLNHTVVRHHQDMGRSNRKPWWQKTGFDIILLLIAIYGVTQLRTQEILPTLNEGTGEDFIKQNPLLYLVPALCSVSLTLVTLRLLPFISGAIAKSLRHTKQVASLLAVRQLSRQSSQYTTPIIILVLTLSLAIFTSSMATTLQHHDKYTSLP